MNDEAAYVIGVDGGGTRSRIAVAGADGRELLRRAGPAGLVDPRDPAASAATLITVIRRAAREADVPLPVSALCAGLAGAGDVAMRLSVQDALAAAGLATRVEVVTDGVIALDGALEGRPGILLVAGTGSVAYGRSETGQTERCGGWGMMVGDEGSGYCIARAGLQSALQAVDGRGPDTDLLPALIEATGVSDPNDIPAWSGRADKGEVAALAPRVLAVADQGDAIAEWIVREAVGALVRHVEALVDRLGPWSEPVPVVFHGGVLGDPALARRVEARLAKLGTPVERREATADAVTGALRRARALAGLQAAPPATP